MKFDGQANNGAIRFVISMCVKDTVDLSNILLYAETEKSI